MNLNLPELFDYNFYSEYYTDLKQAFGDNKQLLERHYLVNGQFENRKYVNIPDDFDWKKYILDNPSFFKNMEYKTKNDAINHFLKNENSDESCESYKLIKNNDYKPIVIVYYAFLNNDKNWRKMIKEQIYDIVKTKIFDVVYKFHLVLLGDKNDIEELKQILRNCYENIEIEYTEVYENKYEFPAIKKIKDLAVEHPDKIFIYLHSKGMVNNNIVGVRTQIEMKLTRNTFIDWESTLFAFEIYPEIQKAGILPDNNGLMLYNFWWARGSYLVNCEPIELKDKYDDQERFYCECWLATSPYNNKGEDGYSLIRKKIYPVPRSEIDVELWNKTPDLYF